MSEILIPNGHSAILANSGELALSIINKQKPDLIILDIEMPEIDGCEICRRLKDNEKHTLIPTIFLATQDEDRIQGYSSGAIDFINKPFIKEKLLLRIKVQFELINLNKKLKKEIAEKTTINKKLQKRESELSAIYNNAPSRIGFTVNLIIS